MHPNTGSKTGVPWQQCQVLDTRQQSLETLVLATIQFLAQIGNNFLGWKPCNCKPEDNSSNLPNSAEVREPTLPGCRTTLTKIHFL